MRKCKRCQAEIAQPTARQRYCEACQEHREKHGKPALTMREDNPMKKLYNPF